MLCLLSTLLAKEYVDEIVCWANTYKIHIRIVIVKLQFYVIELPLFEVHGFKPSKAESAEALCKWK